MAQRDYVSRGRSSKPQRKKTHSKTSKKKKQSQLSPLLIGLAIAILGIFISGLWFISHHKSKTTAVDIHPKKENSDALPPKPDKAWSYIKKLEERPAVPSLATPTVSPEPSTAHPPLTDEQKQLLEQMSADMRNQPTQLNEVPWNQQSNVQNLTPSTTTLIPKTPTPRNSQQNPNADIVSPKSQASISANKNNATASGSNQQTATKKILVQCGSFKGVEQAESVRAQLAFEGFESRLTTSNGWHRVVIGPFANTAKTTATLKRLHNSRHTACITVSTKG